MSENSSTSDMSDTERSLVELCLKLDQLASENLRQADRRPLNKLVYHYTDLHGAMEMIKSDAMWFSERSHMNDPAEIRYGLNLGITLIGRAKGPAELKTKILNDVMSAHLPRVWERIGFFMSSFSTDCYSLPQWRSYADDGRGVALGMLPDIRPTATGANDKVATFLVSYEQLALEKFLKTGIDAAVPWLLSADVSSMQKWMPKLAAALTEYFLLTASMFKHHAYAFENEYRLLVVASKAHRQLGQSDKVRYRPGEIVHFSERELIPPMKLSLQHIQVGPCASETVIQQLADLLALCGYPKIKIDQSDIPYRSVRGY